jgi:two-component system, cell cycle response regulator DivK
MVPMSARSRSVLVVDDSTDGREMLSEYLRFRGFLVSEAADGQQAIDLALRDVPAIILMDLSMPGISGAEATRRIKAHPLTRHIPIIAVTAQAFVHQQANAREAGCDGLVVKPFDLVLLADALDRIIEHGVAAWNDSDPRPSSPHNTPRKLRSA